MSLKVLQVVDTLGMGGAETWLMEVLRVWAKRGLGQMDFLATSGERGLFDAEAEQLGARIHYIRYTRRDLPSFARAFRRLLREKRYDAIHDHQDYASGWHYLLGQGLLPPVRATHVHNPAYQIRNNYGVSISRRLTARLGAKFVARWATHITGTSSEVLREYGFLGDDFAHLARAPLYCGFDPVRFQCDRQASRGAVLREFGWPQDAKVILFAGRIDLSPDPRHPQAHKNAGFAVDTAIAAARRDASVHLLLAGKASPAVALLEQRIADAGLAGRIVFGGIRHDIERLMAGSDLLLFPSRAEGLGMVAVEAQAAGLPVLASSAVPRECVVVPDLVVFRDLADGPEAWATDLLLLAQRPNDAARANREVDQSAFAIANSVAALEALYREGRL